MIATESPTRPAIRAGALLKGGRWIAGAGFLYVIAWVMGLAVAPSGPAATAPASVIAAYYRDHGHAALLQTYLLDGVAGAAILVFAAALHSAMRRVEDESAPLSSILFGGGITAASVSFVQAALGAALPTNVAGRTPETTQMLFTLFNDADTFKMVGLALLIASAALLILRTQSLPRWLGWLGAALSAALIVGGLSFVLGSDVLYGVLYAALPLLLLWVAAVGVMCLRRA